MITYVCGSTFAYSGFPYETLPKKFWKYIEELMAEGDEILLGDSEFDHSVYGRLRAYNYENISVIKSLSQSRYRPASRFKLRWLSNTKMIRQCDRMIAVWDGESQEAFLNMLLMAALVKPCRLYHLNLKDWIDIHSIEGIAPYVPKREGLTAQDIENVMKRCGFDEQMTSFTAANGIIHEERLAEIICRAPVSLKTKISIIMDLQKKDNINFTAYNRVSELIKSGAGFELIDQAIVESVGSFGTYLNDCRYNIERAMLYSDFCSYYLFEEWYDTDVLMVKSSPVGMFVSMKNVMDHVRREVALENEEGGTEGWFRLEVWQTGYKKLFCKVEEGKSYLASELKDIFEVWYSDKLKNVLFPQYRSIDSVKTKVIKEEAKGCAYDELMEMIGLDRAKNVIKQALDYNKAQKVFADKGMKNDRNSMHMVFTGNPGTAKTSAARLFARIMRDNEVLSRGKLIECGRGDLVGKYVGWTAQIVKDKFEEAKGSVLFIDEAYSLVDNRNGMFGDEAINTIVQEMENNRDDVIVIFAGYPDKMEEFLQRNPGLRSRIAYHVPFDDYSVDELCRIADLIAKKKGLILADDAREKLRDVFGIAIGDCDFGNGRYVRNVIEKAKMAQASRLLSLDYGSVSCEEVRTIVASDIEMPVQKKEKNRFGFCA